MDDVNEFLFKYQPELLSYLDANIKTSSEGSDPLEFVEKVLISWSNFTKGRILGEPSSKERTFWFALYQLEELVEYPAENNIDPYEGFLMKKLAEARELLREWKGLPEDLYATRPGEL